MLKVLIVDDESSIRKGLKKIIPWEKEGFEVIGEASNGIDALQKIEFYHPDIVLTDVVMPQLDGIELAKIIQKKYANIKVIILSSHSDFDYVKQSFKNGVVDYLLKPTLTPSTLIELLKKNFTFQSNKKNLSKNNIKKTISLFFSENHLVLDKTVYQQEFQTYDTFHLLITEKKLYPSNENIEQILLTDLPKNINHLKIVPVEVSQEFYIFLLCGTTPIENELASLLQMIDRFKFIETNCFFILSNSYDSVVSAKEHLNSFMKICRGSYFYYKRSAFIKQNQVKRIDETDHFRTKKYLHDLTNQNFHEVLEDIEIYIHRLIKNFYPEQSLKQFVISIFYHVFSMLEESLADKHKKFSMQIKLQFLNKVHSCLHVEEFLYTIHKTVDQLTTMINELNEQYHSKIIEDILEYIQNNYTKKLTLKNLSDQFHFNYYYLSSFFSNHLHESFSDYLNRLRIEKSKELLKETELNISEIAYEIGYTEVAYFSKVFKKMTGLTPSQYRRKL